MATINLNISINTKSIVAITALLIGSYFAFSVKSTHAQSSSPSGSCALILNSNLSGWDLSLDNHSVPQSSLAVVNFDTSTINYVVNKVNSYNQANAALAQDRGSIGFSLTTGPFSGSYYLTETGAVSPVLLVPVNSGNSYLAMVLNSDKPSKTGVCQKV